MNRKHYTHQKNQNVGSDTSTILTCFGLIKITIYKKSLNISNINPRIRFTIEMEENGKLPFLDVPVSKKSDGSYLNKNLNYHSKQTSVERRANRFANRIHGICLRSVKNRKDSLTSSKVCRIPCSCRSTHIGTTKRSIKTKTDKHKRNCWLEHNEKSAEDKRVLTDGYHQILLEKNRCPRHYSRVWSENGHSNP